MFRAKLLIHIRFLFQSKKRKCERNGRSTSTGGWSVSGRFAEGVPTAKRLLQSSEDSQKMLGVLREQGLRVRVHPTAKVGIASKFARNVRRTQI